MKGYRLTINRMEKIIRGIGIEFQERTGLKEAMKLTEQRLRELEKKGEVKRK